MTNTLAFRSVWVPLGVLFVSMLCAYTIVSADTASTSVTVGNSAPVTSAATFNGGSSVTLTENTFVNATGTVTVTDANGCSTISSVTAKFYLASTSNSGSNCTYDGNTCYTSVCTATTTGNQCTGGADTSAEYDCGFQIWYVATPTDGSAPIWSTSIWSFAATSTDGTDSHVATNTAQTIEVGTLNAHNVTASIAFGAVAANTDTGATNQTTTITVTGNTALDTDLSGDDMCTDYPTCAGGVLQTEQQEYNLTSFTYGAGTDLTESDVTVETVLAKPTSTTTPVTDDILWGVGIPNGQTPGSYTGQNTFTAVSD